MRYNTSAVIQTLAAFSLAAITLLTACRSERELEQGLGAFSARFQAANQAETIEPMLALYCRHESDELILSRLKGALNYELGLPIQRIDFEPLSGAPEETIEFTHNGISYGPSLEPLYRMRVIYAVDDHFTSLFTIGQNASGEWQIICARPKPPLHY